MSSKYVDTTAIVQVIGCTFKQPTILDSTDIYNITEDDFIEEFHKIVFGSIYNIYLTGSEVNMNAIIDYLSVRPKAKAVFDKNKGIEYLEQASSVSHEETFNYYYQRLKKMSLLRGYESIGMDVSFLYDPNEILDTKRRQEQEDWLDATPISSIALAIDNKIDEIRSKYVDDDVGQGYQAGDSIDELIEEFQKKPEVGIPLYGSLINTITRGARLRKFYLRSAATGVGKAIPNDTIIPTPMGNKRVDQIKVGDYLWGDDGKPTKVLQVHPQPDKKEIYLVKFLDGREAKCCKEHLWEYAYKSHRGWSTRVETTQQIIDRASKSKYGFKDSNNKGFKFKVKINQPVEYNEVNLPIDPYVFGLMLGDGSFREQPDNKSFAFSSKDDELPAAMAKIMGWSYIRNSEFNYSYSFKNDKGKRIYVSDITTNTLAPLYNVYSQGKFIPEIYKYSSIDQRFALLQGLLDTDGSIDETKGRVNFTNTSRRLIDDVVEICHSLGFVTTVSEDKRSKKYTESCYTIHVQCKKEIKPKLFRLSSKLERANQYAQSDKRAEHKDFLAIIDIQPTGKYTNMTCFTVDNESHLFLMNDYIVTHNTRSMIADACYFACDKIYEAQFGCWIKNGCKEPTLFIATEQDKSEVQTMLLAFLANVNEEHIVNGKYEEKELERVREAASIIKESPLWIEELPDFSFQDIENKIKKYIREYDVKYVVLDYIHTSMKILEEITRRSGGVRLREDNVLFMISTRLKDICNKYGIFILSGTQLNTDYQFSETPDQNLLRGAKSIAD